MNSNELSIPSTTYELPSTALGCAPRESTPEDDNLLRLLIARLDELTRPRPGGKLK